MIRNSISAAAFALLAASPALADQYVVQLDSAYKGASANLKEVLYVTELDSFSKDGKHFIILDAPGDAYVEAFFFAMRRSPVELSVLDADWTKPAMSELTVAQRLGFLKPIKCDFCAS